MDYSQNTGYSHITPIKKGEVSYYQDIQEMKSSFSQVTDRSAIGGYQELDTNDCEILNSYFQIRDSIKGSHVSTNRQDNSTTNSSTLVQEKPISQQTKVNLIKQIDNEAVSKMLLQRIKEKSDQKPKKEKQIMVPFFSQNELIVNSNTLTATCSSLGSQSQQPVYLQLPVRRSSYQNNFLEYIEQPPVLNNAPESYRQLNQFTPIKTHIDYTLSQQSAYQQLDPSKNLGVFSFMLDKSPYSNKKPPRCNNDSNMKQKNHASNNKSNVTIQSDARSNSFIKDCSENEVQKFSPLQSKQSGQRMYNQYYIYKNRLEAKKNERDQQIMSEMKDKPSICKKSDQIVIKTNLTAPNSFREQLKRHENCYFGGAENDHQPCQNQQVPNERSQIQDVTFNNVKDWIQHQKPKFLTPNNKQRPQQSVSNHKNPSSDIKKSPKSILKKPHHSKQQQLSQRQYQEIQNYQSFGPTISGQTDQQIDNQSEQVLRKLCDQYKLNFDVQQRDNKLIEKILEATLSKNNNINKKKVKIIKPEKIQRSIKDNSSSAAAVVQKQPQQNSIVTQLKDFRNNPQKQNSYFNVQVQHGKPNQPNPPVSQADINKVLNKKQITTHDYFKNILRNEPSSNKSYHQVRSQKSPIKSPNKSNIDHQEKMQLNFAQIYPKKAKAEDIPTYERHLVWKNAKENKNLYLKQEKEQQEMQECAFKPQISNYYDRKEVQSRGNSAGNLTYRDSVQSQSPILSSRPQYSYRELSEKKYESKRMIQDKYPHQVQLRVRERVNSFCESPDCCKRR